MGYPMSWMRVINRNQLQDGYQSKPTMTAQMVAGDLERLKLNTLDDLHVWMYATAFGISQKKVRELFECFFAMDYQTESVWARARDKVGQEAFDVEYRKRYRREMEKGKDY